MRIEDVIGHWITQGRQDTGMTQAQIGDELGKYLGKPWPRQAVSAAEKGRRSFTAAELVAFAVVLGCNVEKLIEPPEDVSAVTLSEGPPLDSRHLRAAAATNTDLKELLKVIQELRRAAPDLRDRTYQVQRLVDSAARELWTAARGRGIEVTEERLTAQRKARWAAANAEGEQ